jgi:diacylglycerol kinase (ATP)
VGKRVQIVVTPGSGEGRALSTARRIRRALGGQDRDASIQTFADLRALGCWARNCDPDFTHVVAVGGDATLSAAAVAAVRHGVPFVPVPNGFGNVFARVFGHPDRAAGVVQLLSDGEVWRVDVGLAGEEIFLSHRSYGFLEAIQQATERGRRQPRTRTLRLLAYYDTARRGLLGPPPAPIRVEVDGTTVAEDAVLVTVANVETYRGFLSLTPSASPIDGMFDVFVVPRTGKVRLTWRLLRLMLRLPGRWKGVALYRGRRVVVTTPARREDLRVARRRLPLLVPPGAIARLQQRVVEDDAPVAQTA